MATAAPTLSSPARTAATRPDDSSRRSRVQAARPNGPAAPLTDWAQRQAQAAGPRVALTPAQPAGGVVELKGNGTFAPPAAVAEHLAAQRRAAAVDVRFGTLAAGSIRVRRSRDRYDTPDEPQAIPLVHPALDPLVSAGVLPVLAVAVRNSAVTGYATVGQGKRGLPAGRRALFDVIGKQPAALGWLGVGDVSLPNHVNKLEAGTLTLQTDLGFGLGGFLKGSGRFGVIDETVAFSAKASASVAGLAKVDLDISRRPDGTLSGKVDVPITYRNFSGRLVAMYADGVVDVTGNVRYSTQKLSGEVTLQVTDAATAREVAKRLLPPSAVRAEAAQAAGTAPGSRTPAPAGPRKGPRAVVGWGTLNAHFSDWLTGSATVIIDGDGDVTVVGRIAPPAVVPLFKRDVRRRFLEVNPKFGFGVPYVARAYIGAEIWVGVVASLEAKLQQIEIVGVYSTKPEVFNEFSIAATLLVIAMAGLEGGVGVEGGLELLGHDVSVGAGIKLTAGLIGKLEARPTLAYRELADPKVGRRGEFSLSGYVEIAAQPFLGLAGTAWIELDSPWWSPAPDKRWPKDLFSKEYMLGGPFGVGADFTYVLGSGRYPEFKPREPTLDGRALMSDLMDDNVPSGSRSKGSVPATWKEKTPPAPPPPAKPPAPRGPSKGRPEQKQTPKPEHQKRWHDGMREVGALTREARERPLAQAEIARRLGAIRARYGFTRLEAKPMGANWEIYAALGDASNEQRPAKARRAPDQPAAPAPAAPPKAVKPAAAPVPTSKPDRVRQRTLAELRRAIEKDATLGQLPAITRSVAGRLRPIGLERLELGPRETDGSVLVSAAASAFTPLARFVPRGLVPSVSVKLIAEIRFSQAPAAAVAARPIVPTDEFGRPLPVGAISIERRGQLVHEAGAVLPKRADEPPTVVRVVTWNTDNVDKDQNVSHAEHQFVNWLVSEKERWPYIERIMVNLRPLSPCSYCAARLAWVLREIATARGRAFAAGTGPRGRGPGEAILTWTRIYRWTLADDVDRLTKAEWRVHAPRPRQGDLLDKAMIVIVPPDYRPPR
jgi:hypothetical protein